MKHDILAAGPARLPERIEGPVFRGYDERTRGILSVLHSESGDTLEK
jgi:hypothetical protein